MHPVENIYREGIRQLYQTSSNKHSALEYFRNGIVRDPSSCDFYRGMLACTSDTGSIKGAQYLEIYDRRGSYGDLSRAVEIPAGYPLLAFDMEWMGLLLDISSSARLHPIEAIRRTNSGDYYGASQVIDVIDTEPSEYANHPYAALAKTYLHFVTRRWVDVLSFGEPLIRATARDPFTDAVVVNEDGKAIADRMLNASGYLMLGIAAAHLARYEEAIQRFEVAASIDNIFIQSEALRHHALVLRNKGDKAGAHNLLAHAASIVETKQIRDTIDNELEFIVTTSAEMIDARTDKWDASTEPSLKDREEEDNNDRLKIILREAEEELAKQIGMEGVKDQVNQLKAAARFNQNLKERGLAAQTTSNHLILTGPPGTGKTTIARVIAKIYAGYGVVDDPEVVETSRQDFVGKYEGESAIKTEETFRKARGKVLFIDEAYDLIQDRDGRADPFGQEAVTVLLQEMENHREDTIVIIAGYEGDIKRFLATNDGLQSRFNSWIRFESYSPQELAEISKVISLSRGDVFGDDAFNAVVEKTQGLEHGDHRGVRLVDKLGNGRFARNIVESAAGERLRRLQQVEDLSVLSDEDLMRITAEDVVAATTKLIESAL